MVGNGASGPNELPFSYEEFKAWYEELCVRRLEPARDLICNVLREYMKENLTEFEEVRIRLAASRVKTAARAWAKLHQPKYRAKATALDRIPDLLDDLVGIRIVCNNISDITTVQNMLGDLPASSKKSTYPLTVLPKSEKLYFQVPKDSGYRAYHINLQIRVPAAAKYHNVTVELQVRTILQDGWGELTHEDTYKTALKLPPLAQSLAKRMANLLLCVDEIAQDLRNELDELTKNPEEQATASEVIFESALAENLPADTPAAPSPESIERVPEDALLQETASLVSNLTQPTSLASIAHQLRKLFGEDIARDSWGGFSSFKSLLLKAVPDAEIINAGPGMLIPHVTELAQFELSEQKNGSPDQDANIPQVMRKLSLLDRHAPAVSAETLARLLRGVEVSLREAVWEQASIPQTGLGPKEINTLSKHARDVLRGDGVSINRAKLGYLLTALSYKDKLQPGLPMSSAQKILLGSLECRIKANSITAEKKQLAAVREWFARAVALSE
jgi:ppGpp synthetase/RelA/SpoT-type nucleotidyltranferase